MADDIERRFASIRLPKEGSNYSPSILVDNSSFGLFTIDVDAHRKLGEQIQLGFTGGGKLSHKRRQEAARKLGEHEVAITRPLNDSMLTICDPLQLEKALGLLDIGDLSIRRVVHYMINTLFPSIAPKSPEEA
jgi:hypothetical protein